MCCNTIRCLRLLLLAAPLRSQGCDRRGSKSCAAADCKSCHNSSPQKWSSTKHTNAPGLQGQQALEDDSGCGVGGGHNAGNDADGLCHLLDAVLQMTKGLCDREGTQG